MTNLLLLFSAMLSALIGVGPGARVTQAPVAVASATTAHPERIAVKRAAARPLAPPIALTKSLCFELIILIVAQGLVPAWKTRRRE